MSKVSILAKTVPFETLLVGFLFCDGFQGCKECVLYNGNLMHRVPCSKMDFKKGKGISFKIEVMISYF